MGNIGKVSIADAERHQDGSNQAECTQNTTRNRTAAALERRKARDLEAALKREQVRYLVEELQLLWLSANLAMHIERHFGIRSEEHEWLKTVRVLDLKSEEMVWLKTIAQLSESEALPILWSREKVDEMRAKLTRYGLSFGLTLDAIENLMINSRKL